MYYKMFTLLILLYCHHSHAQKGDYLSPENFFKIHFSKAEKPFHTLWINKEQRQAIEKILKHSFHQLRIRYARDDKRTGWIFEEIGKELPITIGVIIEEKKVYAINVLSYRESRGGEIRYPFFTNQFLGASLKKNNKEWELDQHIDGITGATLSVWAMKKITKVALFCDSLIHEK